MRILVIFLMALAVRAEANCFDFDHPATKPMHDLIGLSSAGDNREYGKYDSGITWGAARGELAKPASEVLRLLLDHNTTKSARVDEMEVVRLPKPADPSYLERHRVKFLIKPFPFVKVRWQEDWSYVLTGGSAKDPTGVVISFEKVEGTSHIEHLCGSMVLRKLAAGSTDVFLYEEAKATNRSPEDTVNGLLGTLKTLRK